MVIFEPNSHIEYLAPYLCVCQLCQDKLGSLDLFQERSLPLFVLESNVLKSKIAPNCNGSEEDADNACNQAENEEDQDEDVD